MRRRTRDVVQAMPTPKHSCIWHAGLAMPSCACCGRGARGRTTHPAAQTAISSAPACPSGRPSTGQAPLATEDATALSSWTSAMAPAPTTRCERMRIHLFGTHALKGNWTQLQIAHMLRSIGTLSLPLHDGWLAYLACDPVDIEKTRSALFRQLCLLPVLWLLWCRRYLSIRSPANSAGQMTAPARRARRAAEATACRRPAF